MSSQNPSVSHGYTEARGGSLALAVASRGIHTMADMANFTQGLSVDVLQDRFGDRQVNTSVRCTAETRKLIMDGQRIGYHKPILNGNVSADQKSLQDREAELTAELEAIREQRGS